MSSAIQVVTTTATKADAQRIAEQLVARRLAACVQIDGPLESWYRWQGKLEQATEWRCAIKTRSSLFAQVEQALRELHPYDEPEILAFEVTAGSAGYLAWLEGETKGEE